MKLVEDPSVKGEMPLENLNLKISERDVADYQRHVNAYYERAQEIYKTDFHEVKGSLLDVSAKIRILVKEWLKFKQDWRNTLKFDKMVWTDNDKASAIALKSIHTSQVLRSLQSISGSIELQSASGGDIHSKS